MEISTTPFLTKTGGSAVSRPVNLLYISPDQVDGDIWKWNFDIQRELPYEMALTVAYVGNKGTHTGNSISNFNDVQPSTNTNTQSRRPNQQFYDPATPQLGVQPRPVPARQSATSVRNRLSRCCRLARDQEPGGDA